MAPNWPLRSVSDCTRGAAVVPGMARPDRESVRPLDIVRYMCSACRHASRYAKVHGCYEAVVLGTEEHALEEHQNAANVMPQVSHPGQ